MDQAECLEWLPKTICPRLLFRAHQDPAPVAEASRKIFLYYLRGYKGREPRRQSVVSRLGAYRLMAKRIAADHSHDCYRPACPGELKQEEPNHLLCQVQYL